MKRTIVQKYASAIIGDFLNKMESLSGMNHKLTKGELRESFVGNVFEHFLPEHFGIGSGIIVNQAGKQSNQTDIIIFDKRVIPPFLGKQKLGVYPAESVIAVIEVKSNLTKDSIIKADNDFKILREEIYNPDYSYYKDYSKFRIITGIIGFYGNGTVAIRNEETGISWLNSNISNLNAICLCQKYTWLKYKGKWHYSGKDKKTFEEIKRFIAWFIDNIRLLSNKRYEDQSSSFRSWMSIYLRDQENVRNHFEEIEIKLENNKL